MKRHLCGLAMLLSLGAGGATASTFELVYEPLFEPDAAQQALLDDAAAFWESFIIGYQPGVEMGPLTVEIGGYAIDGPDEIYAEANFTDTTAQAGYVLPTAGFIDFDTDDTGPLDGIGLLYPVLLHETAHVMGFGTLWAANGLLRGGDYVGPAGLAAYRAEFDPMAAVVPVEREGGEGTALGHWAEDWAGGYQELMTGFVDDDPYLSATTVLSFADLGYLPAFTVADIAPVPLPAGIWGGLGALGLLAGLARRRARA